MAHRRRGLISNNWLITTWGRRSPPAPEPRRFAARRRCSHARLGAPWALTTQATPEGHVHRVVFDDGRRLDVVVHQRGTPPAFAFPAREHDAIGPAIGLDFETGVAIATMPTPAPIRASA